LEFHSAGKNSFKVISSLDYFTDKRPVAGEAVEWRLQPSEGCTWEKGPDQKTDPNGKAFGTLTIGTDESRRVSVTTTHIPTGTSGTGSFVFGGSEGVQIQPARNLGKATEPCEWSTNGFFAVRHTNGSGLSIYRVSDWRKVWSKRRGSGKYHSFSFSPNGMKLAAGVFKDKDEIAVLNVPAGKVDDIWDASVEGESKTTDRSFVWNGSDIYSIQNDNVIRKWSVSGSLEMDFTHDAEIEEFRFNPAVDSQFAALDKNGVLKIWDKNSAAPVKTVNVESVSTGRLKCLAWSRDGKKLVVGSGMGDTGGIYTFDTSSWSKSGFDLPGLGKVNSLDYNNDSSRLAVGHDKGLMVLNTKTFSVEYYNAAATNHVRWSPDGSMLAAGGQVYFFNDANFNGPKIEIAAPQSNASFSADSTEIKGKITGLHKIRSAGVSVNGGEPEALALGSDGAFKKRISLKEGGNTILIQAEDLLKNTASFSMTIGRRADSTPPALTEANVGSAIGVKGTPIHFSVRVLDGDSGIDPSKVTAKIRLPEGDTGATVQLYDDGEHGDKKPGDGLFANGWNSSEAGEGFHAVDFYAVDRAGNTGSLEGNAKIFVYDRPAIKKPYLSTATPMSKESVNVNAVITDTSGVQSADLLYSADAGRSWSRVDMSSAGTTYIGTIPPQGAGTVYYKIKALDLHGFDSEAGSYAFIVRDDTGPMISIQEPSTTIAAFTSEPFVLVSGRAADIDGPGLKSVTCSSGAANTGTIEEWSFRVPLNKGINPITVVAESLSGKLAIDSIEVTYALKLAAPAFSPDVPHIFTDPVSVEISTSDNGAMIRYTTDSTDPTEASPGVTSLIRVAGTTTIKARAYMSGWTPSDTAVGTFTLKKKEQTDVVKAASLPEEKSAVKSESVSSPKEKSAERPEPGLKKETPSLVKKSEAMVSLAVQVAAFRDRKFAEDLVKKLKNKGFSAYSVPGKSPGKATWHKVRIGPFKNKEDVETALEGLEKYKKKAIIIVDQTGALPENEEDPKHSAKKDLKTKPAVPAAPDSPKASSAQKKPKAAMPTDRPASEVETKKSTVKETASVIEIPALPASNLETKTETLPRAKVKETTPSAGTGKEPLALKSEISDGESQKERLKSFLRIYSRAYESKDLDKFVALFTYDAIENNRPFYEMLPKYRKNMEMIESFKYDIEMIDYAVMADTGNITVQGKFFTQYLLRDGTRDEKSGNISMELEEDGNSFLVKRLNYGE
jgi:WD40 repeat protein/cell division septation protein DedD